MPRPWMALLAVLALAGLGSADHSSRVSCPDLALKMLMDGNRRFVAGTVEQPHADREWRCGLASGQHPVATVLSCSDSRVPPELIFDQGLGDLFVIRLAGNVVDEDVEASVEYGVLHTGTPLVMVLGHESCGAVTAALGNREAEPLPIQSLLKRIIPAVKPAEGRPMVERVAEAVDANVLQSVRELRCVPGLEEVLQAGKVKVAGGVYDLDTGEVRLLN